MDTSPTRTARTARETSRLLATAETPRKNAALEALAERLDARRGDIVSANRRDMENAEAAGVAENMVKRLSFDDAKIDGRIVSLRKIAALPDPVGQPFGASIRPNGLEVARVRAPLGVVLMIYEARPHVTVNAGAFCLKSGNAAILRGGSEAKECNALMGELWRDSLEAAGLPGAAVQVISGSHEEVDALLGEVDNIDLVIPRGGHGLIEHISRTSRIPVIKHFAGVCHAYVDETADPAMAKDIVIDSKCLMPAVCNALETVLVDAAWQDGVADLVATLGRHGVTVRGCERTRAAAENVEPATEEDWTTEYLDLVVSMRMVDGVGEAIDHINRYGSHHTDTIVTNDLTRAARFRREVDSAVVLTNASTMFCDGETLGMGAEIGISTDKLHARGPMGLEELTTYKFDIRGTGQIMGGGA